jgi:hypothetical protein
MQYLREVRYGGMLSNSGDPGGSSGDPPDRPIKKPGSNLHTKHNVYTDEEKAIAIARKKRPRLGIDYEAMDPEVRRRREQHAIAAAARRARKKSEAEAVAAMVDFSTQQDPPITGGVFEPVTAAGAAIAAAFKAALINPTSAIVGYLTNQILAIGGKLISIPIIGKYIIDPMFKTRGTSFYRLLIKPLLAGVTATSGLVYGYDRTFQNLLGLYGPYVKEIANNETNFINLVPAYYDMYLYLESIIGVLDEPVIKNYIVTNDHIMEFYNKAKNTRDTIKVWIDQNYHMSGDLANIHLDLLEPDIKSKLSIINYDIQNRNGVNLIDELEFLFTQYYTKYPKMFDKLLDNVRADINLNAPAPRPPKPEPEPDYDMATYFLT